MSYKPTTAVAVKAALTGRPSMTSARAVSEMRLGDHCCLGFEADEDRHEILADYVSDGLAAKQKILYFADDPATVKGWLDQRGPAVLDAMDHGQLVFASSSHAYAPSGFFEPAATIRALREQVAAALAGGFSGLRVTGEMGWASDGLPGRHGLLEYETEVQQVFDTGMVMGVCQYDVRRFSHDDLAQIVAAHPHLVAPNPVYTDAQLHVTRTIHPRGLTFAGELDAWNVGAVAEALRPRLRGRGDLDLDLTELVFCDIGGIRALMDCACSLGPERRLVLHGLPAQLRAVIDLVGWSDHPGLVIAHEEAA